MLLWKKLLRIFSLKEGDVMTMTKEKKKERKKERRKERKKGRRKEKKKERKKCN